MQVYLDGLLNGDAEKAISSFAIETFTTHFDWKTYAERRSMYLPNSYSPDWFGSEQVNLPFVSAMQRERFIRSIA